MSSRGAKKKGGPPFVQLFHWMLRSPAWADLDPVARALYVELKQHYTGSNNGRIGFSARQAGEALGMSAATASRAFLRLEEHGFVVPTAKGRPCSGSAYHLATEWLLTEAFDDSTGQSARRDFMKWVKGVSPVQREEIFPVANIANDVAPVQRDGNQIPQKDDARFTHATQTRDFGEDALHQRNTLTSSHRQVLSIEGTSEPEDVSNTSGDGLASAAPQQARQPARPGRPLSDKTAPPVTPSLLNSKLMRKVVRHG